MRRVPEIINGAVTIPAADALEERSDPLGRIDVVKCLELDRAETNKLDEAGLAAALPAAKGPMFDALSTAFATAFGGAHIEKDRLREGSAAALAKSHEEGPLRAATSRPRRTFAANRPHRSA